MTHQDRPIWQADVTESVRLATLTELMSLSSARLVKRQGDDDDRKMFPKLVLASAKW